MLLVWLLPGFLLWARLGRQSLKAVTEVSSAPVVPRLPERTVRQLVFILAMGMLWPMALLRWSRLKAWSRERPWRFDAWWIALGDLPP